MNETIERMRVGPKGHTQVISGAPWAEVLTPALVELGHRRVLVLCSAGRRAVAEQVATQLAEHPGLDARGLFAEAEAHVPRALAERALAELEARGADTLIAVGGGAVIGLAKAVALLATRAGRARPLLVALPTTYAGSEMTAIWGLERDDGTGKQVGRDEAVRFELAIYDPALTAGLPAKLALPSLFNAMAHAVDALYPLEQAESRPATLVAAITEAIAELSAAITALGRDAQDGAARRKAMVGAQRAGAVLDRAGMSLHHKLAHVLGGRWSLPHAATHTILLPQVVAFMARAAPWANAALGEALTKGLGRERPVVDPAADPAAALSSLAREVGAPVDLLELGLARDQLDAAVDEVLAAAVVSPRPLTRSGLRELLDDAWLGRPASGSRRRLAPLARSGHGSLPAALAGPPLAQAQAAVIAVHGRGGTAEAVIAQLEQLLAGLPEGLAIVAPQAEARRWYPRGFAQPVARNQPELDDAIDQLAALRRHVATQVAPTRTLLFGFSQGACLVLDQVARSGGPLAGVVAIAGALIGEAPVAPWHDAELPGLPVIVGIAERDAWVPRARVDASADHLEARGARVQRIWAAGSEHTVTTDQAQALRQLVAERLGLPPRGPS